MRLFNDTVMDEAAATADKTGEAISLGFMQDIALQIIWTSTTCAGVIKVQCSNNNVDWTDIASAAQTVNNNNGNVMISISDANYAWLRCFFDFTSGSLTTLKVIANGKGV